MPRASASKRHAAVRAALERARAAGQDETVVFHLSAQTVDPLPTAAQFERLAEGLIRKVAHQCGRTPKHKTLFGNLGSMAVRGDVDFLLRLLDQPEVREATFDSPKSGLAEPIRPVRKSAPTARGWVELPD